MSEPTNAQMAEQEDLALDAQIAEYEHEKYEQRMRDEAAIADDTEPDREPPEEDRMVRTTFGLARQQRSVMGQDEDGTPNGLDYVETRWVSQWERI